MCADVDRDKHIVSVSVWVGVCADVDSDKHIVCVAVRDDVCADVNDDEHSVPAHIQHGEDNAAALHNHHLHHPYSAHLPAPPLQQRSPVPV